MVMRFIDRALYLRRNGLEMQNRLEATYVPTDVGFATKPKLATRMIARAIAASLPFKWVAGDTVYGVGNIEQQLRKAGKGYVLGVSSAHIFHSWGKRPPVTTTADLAGRGPHPTGSACRREPGPKDRGCTRLGVISNWPVLQDRQFNAANDGLWTRGLTDDPSSIADGDLTFFTTWCPAGTTIETLVAVEGHQWAIEDSFETASETLI